MMLERGAQLGEKGGAVGGVLFGLDRVAADDIAAAVETNLLDLEVVGDRLVAAGAGEDIVRDGPLPPQRAAEDIVEGRFGVVAQRRQGLLAEHATIGNDNRTPDAETLPETADGQPQRLGIGRVAGQHFESHRPALAVDSDTQDQLRQIRAAVAAVAVSGEFAGAVPVEIERAGIDENEVELGREQIALLEEQVLLERFSDPGQPRQRPVEMVQRQRVEAGGFDRPRPGCALEIRARRAQPLQRQREGDPLGIEAEPTAFGVAAENLGQTLLLPQPAKNQRRPPAPGLARGQPVFLGCLDHPKPRAEPPQRLKEAIELTGGDEPIATPEARHQLLPHPCAIPYRAHDLQVLVTPAFLNNALGPDEHAVSVASKHQQRQSKTMSSFQLTTTSP